MKVLILVQSIEEGHYPEIIQTQELTWDSVSHNNIKTFFYIPHATKTGLTGNKLYIKGPITMEFMYMHFMKACIEVLKMEWDYIFKTDNSTYINKDMLWQLLSSKPRTKYYGGHPYFQTHPERNNIYLNPLGIKEFMWGDGYALSRDLVIKLIDIYALNPYHLRGSDDDLIGFILQNICEADPTLLISCFYDEDFSIIPKKPIYRCTPHDLSAESIYKECMNNMKAIHQRLTS